MCGIVGFANLDAGISASRKKWFAQALFVDRLRGEDATGVCVVPRTYTGSQILAPLTYKRALSSPDFMMLGKANKLLNDVDDCAAVIGHNRWATKGKAGSDDNAHPFSYGPVTMVHNGTLLSRNGLTEWDEVDSRSIAKELSKTAPDKYTNVLSALDGAYTLVWYNESTEKLYMARNKERPLWLCTGFGNKTLYFASEPWMITGLLDRIGGSNLMDVTKKGKLNLWEMPVNTLFEVDLNKKELTIDQTTYQEYERPKYSTGSHGSSSHSHNASSGYSGGSSKLSVDGCPLKCGDYALLKEWSFIKDGINGMYGRVVGSEYMHPEVRVVIPNVKEYDYTRLFSKGMKLVEESTDPSEFLMLSARVYSVGNLNTSTVPGTKYLVNGSLATSELALYTEPTSEEEDAPFDSDTAPYTINGKVVTPQEWDAATQEGCCMCNQNIFRHQRAGVTWLATIQKGKHAKYEPICEDCSNDLDKQAGAV